MTLKYNKENAVYRKDLGFASRVLTENLNNENVVGRESDIQTDSYYKLFTDTGTQILAQDIILTSIVFTVSGDEAGGWNRCTGTATINGINVHTFGIDCLTSATSGTLVISIPNWLLKAGEIIGTTRTSGLDNDTYSVSFIGYLA